MSKKMTKIIMMISTIIYIICTLSIISSATDTNVLYDIYNVSGDTTYANIASKIIGLVQFICYAAAVIILLYKGVGLMQKAPEAKAEAKKELIAYAVGAFILFGIGSIIRIIGNIALNNLF